jgi:hypothetical protein
MVEKKYTNGLEAINRVRLLMQYSLDKTLSENIGKLSILKEQAPKVPSELQNIIPKQGLNVIQSPRPETSKNNWEKDKKEYQSKNPEMVWDPNSYDTTRPGLDKYGKTIYPKGNWVEMGTSNVGLRGTPFGFHPSEYPEYLKKVAQIKLKYPETNPNRVMELVKLRKEYYHEEFPFGITKEDYNDWSTARASLNTEKKKEFDKITKEFSSQYKSSKNMPGSDYFLNVANQNTKKYEMMNKSQISSDFKTMDDFLNAIFQYDPIAYKEINKGWLEKWWDDYGLVAEFIAWVVVDIFSEGFLIPATEARQAYVLAKILKIAVRSGLPVAAGVARSLQSGYITENAVMDFVFAILPWAHNYFSIAKKPSTQLVESIVSKRKGLNLTNPDNIRKYIKSLTEEEKYFFKKIAKINKIQLESGIQKSMKEIGIKSKQLKTVNKIGDDVLKTTGKKIKPNFSKKVGKFLGRMAFIDLPAIEIANFLARKYGFLDEYDKIEALKKLFENKQGTDLLILIANAAETIKKYPNLSKNETIRKMFQENLVKTEDDAIEIFTNEDFFDLLVDGNGDPIK